MSNCITHVFVCYSGCPPGKTIVACYVNPCEDANAGCYNIPGAVCRSVIQNYEFLQYNINSRWNPLSNTLISSLHRKPKLAQII